MNYIMENIGTIIVGFVLFVVLFFILKSLVSPNKKSGCAGGCSGCSACDTGNNGQSSSDIIPKK